MKKFLLTIALAVVAIVLIGCGSGGDNAGPQDNASQEELQRPAK